MKTLQEPIKLTHQFYFVVICQYSQGVSIQDLLCIALKTSSRVSQSQFENLLVKFVTDTLSPLSVVRGAASTLICKCLPAARLLDTLRQPKNR